MDDRRAPRAHHADQPVHHARVEARMLAEVPHGDALGVQHGLEAFRIGIVERHDLGVEPVGVEAAGQRCGHTLRAGPLQRGQHFENPDLHGCRRAGQYDRAHSVVISATTSHVGLYCSQVRVETPTAHTASITAHSARSGKGMAPMKMTRKTARRENSAKPMIPDSTSTERNVL